MSDLEAQGINPIGEKVATPTTTQRLPKPLLIKANQPQPNLTDSPPLESQPAVAGDDELTAMIDFLCGKESLDGQWYGERRPDRPAFWWRKRLQAIRTKYISKEEAADSVVRVFSTTPKEIDKGIFVDREKLKAALRRELGLEER